ncbi:MAG: hypothetical protein LUC91_11550, partial [Prevotella sp.]|nr:hypothetical protein [Prevotella sp.]
DMETTNNYDKFDGSEYKAMTTTQDVQRNYIYPIKLQFDTYNVEFEIQAWTAPIDLKAETEYTTSAEWHEDGDGYYQITLRDITSSFTITPKLYQISEDVSGDRLKTEQSGITWEWIQGDDDEYILSQSESDGTLTVTQLTAMADYYYSFKLNAKWSTTTNGITIEHERTYNVKVMLNEGGFSLDGGETYYQIKRMLPLVAK